MAEKPSSPAYDIGDLVTCSICLENFKDARALPCIHSFCKECLQGLVTPQKKLTCPHCRMEVEVPNGDASNLKPNFIVNKIIDMLNLKKKTDDFVGNADRANSVPLCRNHPEKECEFFCHHCSEFICDECKSIWSTCSMFHSHETIDRAAKRNQRNVKEYLREKEELLSAVKRHLAVLAQLKAKESTRVFDVSEQISASFAKHMERLKKRQEELTTQATVLHRKNNYDLSSEVNQIQLKQAEIESMIEFYRQILGIENPVLFIQKYTEFKEQFRADSVELVTEIELDNLCYQAKDSLLTEAISNFGSVVPRNECSVVEEERQSTPEPPQQPKRSRRRGKKQGPRNDPAPSRPDVRHAATDERVTWEFYNRDNASADVRFEDNGYSVKTTSPRNVAIIGKPGFQRGRHSWKIRVVGFAYGISVGVCVGQNGCGTVVTYDSPLTIFNTATSIHVKLDCDAKTLSVLRDGCKTRDVVGFDNPRGREVYPYFYLPPPDKYCFSKITVLTINDRPVVSNQWQNEMECCIL